MFDNNLCLKNVPHTLRLKRFISELSRKGEVKTSQSFEILFLNIPQGQRISTKPHSLNIQVVQGRGGFEQHRECRTGVICHLEDDSNRTTSTGGELA